ncbi:MAG: TIGR02147 family protein [Fibrobacteres bacterium]|nr:TIGR02147 family protein [Fibrobacterota bacterium]
MRSIFEYLDYRDLLRDAFEQRKAKSPLYGYRMMAEALGQDTSNIFRILQKDAHLPARCQSRAIEYLGLTGRSAEYFVLLIAYARERDSRARHDILDKAMALRDVASRDLVDKELAYFREWWIVAVRSMVEVMEGRVQPAVIASRLRPPIPEADVTKALDLLLELSLVKKASSGRLVLTEAHLNAGGSEKTEAVRHFQRQILALAAESLERFPREERDVSTLTLAVDQEAFKEIREMLREFRQQIQKRVEESLQPDRVMQLSMAFFPLASAPEASQ